MTDASRELKRAKKRLRTEVLARRNALPPEERERLGALLLGRLFTLREVAEAGTVMAFLSFGSEVATDPIVERLHRDGRRVAVPVAGEREIEAVGFTPGDPVSVTAFGVREPLSRDAIDPASIDVVLVPAVAFDRSGFRVGYGGGFYDRFLPRTGPDAFRIGICFSVQMVEEVPRGGMDVRVDAIVTDSGTLRFDRERA